MAGKILDGKALSKQIESELVGRVEKIKEKSGGKTPILATILVGDDPASAILKSLQLSISAQPTRPFRVVGDP